MDDPYPTDGTSFYIPEEDDLTKHGKQEEKQKAVEAAPFLEEVNAWFDEQIQQCDSIEYALDLSQKYEMFTDETLKALNIVRQVLQEKKTEFSTLKLK